MPRSLHNFFIIFSNFMIFLTFSRYYNSRDMGDLVCVDCCAFESIRFCCDCIL